MGFVTAALSYQFHEAMHRMVPWLLRRRAEAVRRAGQQPKWRTMSDDLDTPGILPVISVIGPRWNCHALLASMSPIRVENSLSLELGEFGVGADSWSIVLYDEVIGTRQWTGSATASANVVTWQVPPGNYALSLRYYTGGDDIEVPTVVVDGATRISGEKLRGEGPRYHRHLEKIRNMDGLYFRLLHYYMFFHLSRLRRSQAWLQKHFLPMGNPDTQWEFGHLDIGERLSVRSDNNQQHDYNTYVCFYNWASFPVEWHTIHGTDWTGRAFEQPVGYAIRRVRKRKEVLVAHALAR
jgi:hypothetical protein